MVANTYRKYQLCPKVLSHYFGMMRTHIIHDYNIFFFKARYQLFFHIFTKSLCSCSTLICSIYQTAIQTNRWQNGCSGRRVYWSSVNGTFPMYCMCIASCEICINASFIQIYLMFENFTFVSLFLIAVITFWYCFLSVEDNFEVV